MPLLTKRKVQAQTAPQVALPLVTDHLEEVKDQDGKLLLVGDPIRVVRRPGLNDLGELPAYSAEITRIVSQRGRAVLHLKEIDGGEVTSRFRACLPEQARRVRRGEGHFEDKEAS